MKCETFPKQPSTDNLGNLVKLPLGIHPETNNRCLFTHYNLEPYELNKQWDILAEVVKVTEELVDKILEKYSNLIKIEQSTSIKDNQELYRFNAVKERFYGYPCLKDIYFNGVNNGNRNMATLRLASHLYHCGFKESVVKEVLNNWNKEKNNNPLPDEEIDRTVNSAFSRAYRFGCNDPLLRLYCKDNCRIKKYKGEKNE